MTSHDIPRYSAALSGVARCSAPWPLDVTIESLGMPHLMHRNVSFSFLDFVRSQFPIPHIIQQGSWMRRHLRSWMFTVFPFSQPYLEFIFGWFSFLHEVTPLDPLHLACTDESLLRCRNDDSSHNSSIWIVAEYSKSDAMVDNGIAPLLSVSSGQANASADIQNISFSHHSLSMLQRSQASLCVHCPSRQELVCIVQWTFWHLQQCPLRFRLLPPLSLFRHRGHRHVDGIWWLDATFAAGAHRCENQREGVAKHEGELHRAVAGCRAWAWLGAHHGQRALAQGEPGSRVVRSHIARAWPGAVQMSRKARHTRDTPNDTHTQTHTKTDTFYLPTGIGRVMLQLACSIDVNPLWHVGLERDHAGEVRNS